MQVEDYHPKIAEFRALFKDQLEVRLTGEREGHLEDLLMMTILDPRFKNMDFKGSSGSFLLLCYVMFFINDCILLLTIVLIHLLSLLM